MRWSRSAIAGWSPVGEKGLSIELMAPPSAAQRRSGDSGNGRAQSLAPALTVYLALPDFVSRLAYDPRVVVRGAEELVQGSDIVDAVVSWMRKGSERKGSRKARVAGEYQPALRPASKRRSTQHAQPPPPFKL